MESAQETLALGEADAVAWGKLFIANPDLVERFRNRRRTERAQQRNLLRPRPAGLHRLSQLKAA